MKYQITFVFLLMMVWSQAGLAQTLNVNQNNATLAFAGEHAGMSFDGVFEQWESNLVLPPQDNPNIAATFRLASAKTGDSTYDETLPEEDWFDAETFPTARFESSQIIPVANGYEVVGKLSIKGKTNPVRFILEQKANQLVAAFAIDRLAFGIGVESDPEAEWVSQMIDLKLTIHQ